MKNKFAALISLGLLFCVALSLFSCYPATEWEPQLLDTEIEVREPDKEIVEVETAAISSYKDSSLFMKVNSNYMLSKGARAAIYSDAEGAVWGSPYKIDGVVYVPAKPIATVYLGGNYGWADSVGNSFKLVCSGKTAVVVPGSNKAVYDGAEITLDNPPLLVKGEKCDNEYLVIGLSDVEKLFRGQYVTYDEMGLIGISASKNIFNRDTELNAMVDLMKSFIYDFTSAAELKEMIKTNTNNFDHPYLVGSEEKFAYMNQVYTGEAEDEAFLKMLERQVDLAENYFERFTTLPDSPANPTYTEKANEKNPEKYKHLVVELTNPFSGIKEGEVWSDSDLYFYHKGPDANGYCYPSVLGDSDNGSHYNDGYDWAGSRNSAGVSYAQYVLDLVLAYRITDEVKYAELAYDMMISLCDDNNWHNWSHKHYLSTAEMLFRLGFAYDWAYDAWREIEKDRGAEYSLNYITQCMYRKGLYYGYLVSAHRRAEEVYTRDATGYVNGVNTNAWNWSNCTINWNCVCNSGIVVASMAIAGESGDGINYSDNRYGDNVVDWCLDTHLWNIARQGLIQYAPDGSYIESPGYWSYATNYFSALIWALNSAAGDDLGFFETWGIDKTYYFATHTEFSCDQPNSNADYMFWSYHDSGMGSQQATDLFFFAAEMTGDDTLAVIRLNQLENGKTSSWYDVIGYKKEYGELDISEIKIERDYLLESCEGAVTRSSWEEGALFAGIMGNKNCATDHGQTDSGNFIYTNYMHAWFVELGADQYNAYKYLGHSTVSPTPRYSYYRNSAEGHNLVCLTSQQSNEKYKNGQYHCDGGVISAFESFGDAGMYSILDNTGAYGEFAEYAYRGMLLTNSRQTVVIQDQIKFKSLQSVVWIGHTTDAIAISDDGKEAILSNYIAGKYRQLRVNLISDNPGLKFEVIGAGTKEDEFLLSATHRADYSTSHGGVPEYNRTQFRRLIIRAENVLEFNCAVVMEIVGLNQDAPVRYSYTDMTEWEPAKDDVSYADNKVLEVDKTPVMNTLKSQAALAIRYIDENELFGVRHSAFFEALTKANVAQKQLTQTHINSRDDVKEAYADFKTALAKYKAIRAEVNGQLKGSNPILNYAAYYV